MTHCDGVRAAAVALRRDIVALGIDAEPDLPLPVDVAELVVQPAEYKAWPRLPAASTAWDRTVFSAKESVFKAWFPLTGRWLEFDDVKVELHPNGGFDARVSFAQGDGRLAGLFRWTGRWCAAGGLIATAVVLRADYRQSGPSVSSPSRYDSPSSPPPSGSSE